MRTFFRNSESIHLAKYNRAVLELMSPNLRRQYIAGSFGHWVDAMSFMAGPSTHSADDGEGGFEDTYLNFITDLVLLMEPRAYPAKEVRRARRCRRLTTQTSRA